MGTTPNSFTSGDSAADRGAAKLPPSSDPALPAGLTPPSRRGRSSRLLGQVIVELGFATEEQIVGALAQVRARQRPLGQVLLKQGVLTSDQLARAIAERFGLDHVDLSTFEIDAGVAHVLDVAAAKRYGAVPIGRLARALLVATADPANVVAVDDITLLTGMDVRPVIATPEDIALLIERMNRLESAVDEILEREEETFEATEIDDLGESIDDAPVVKLVSSIISSAVDQGASDIHITPYRGDMRVQYRIDGVLADGFAVPQRLRSSMVARIKVMAEMDISERRVPQDGRLGLTIDDKGIDVRVVTLPLAGGESVIMRILDKTATRIGLDQLGMMQGERERFEHAFHQPHGAVLVTGPTGSGKSTTLYSALGELNTGQRSILTIEDPIEYRMDGVRQMQVNGRAGVTFANGLRSMMRADPDVVMVGEIRDRETAQIAIEAALTGHMVLSTLHTNDAPTATTRLIEMGIEPFLVASALDCVVAQRLARKLCVHCRRKRMLGVRALRANGLPATKGLTVMEAVGCPRCHGTGYRGRTGIYEVMTLDDDVRELILQRASAAAVTTAAIAAGMRRLRVDGLEKVKLGLTSVAEVLRVTA